MFVKNGGGYGATKYQYKINFKYYTYICEIGKVTTLKYGFEFIRFNDIFSGSANSDYLVGVILIFFSLSLYFTSNFI